MLASSGTTDPETAWLPRQYRSCFVHTAGVDPASKGRLEKSLLDKVARVDRWDFFKQGMHTIAW